jgi:predicted outer membrane repeat protein
MYTRTRILSLLVIVTGLLLSTEAAAFCLPIVHHVNVGSSTATGTGCNYVYADLQTAIDNVSCPNTVLSIAGGVTLGNVALTIENKTNLTIVGLGAGTTCNDPPPACDPEVGCGGSGPPPPPNVRLQGTGSGPVFTIHRGSVTLQSLELTGGGGSIGGGINFYDTGSVELVDTKVDNNTATYGGGISFNGDNGDATLTLGAGTIIESNTATQGGGIYFESTGSALKLVTLDASSIIKSNTATFGGGFAFDLHGSLEIDNTKIESNTATYGGGIGVNGSSGLATLTLGAGTFVTSNTATGNGGGILVNGTARLLALEPNTEIAFNHAANGYGGGIEVEGPAQADIGSGGFNGLAVVYGNNAEYGGGISGYATDGHSALIRLFTTDAFNPVAISSNFASHTGGGIYVNVNGVYESDFCAYDYRIDNNSAPEGAAIYADEDSNAGNYTGGNVFLNTNISNFCTEPVAIDTLGAVRCAPGVTCNTVNGNLAMDSSSNPTAGSTILVQTAGGLIANRLIMRNNHGAHVIRTFGPYLSGAYGSVVNCLIADNTLTAEMIRIDDDGLNPPVAETTFNGCTIVNNGKDGVFAPVIYAAHGLTLTNDIIDELGINTLNYAGPGGGLTVSHVLATDITTLPMAAGIDQGEPLYVDAANSDYHLQPTSTGIDFAPASGGQDLDGNPRDVNLSGVAGNSTPRDIGAYERQNRFQCGASDSVFCNSFEYSW